MTSPTTLLKAWNLKPSKNLGQNFLVHAETCAAIAAAADITPNDTVLEIGSGLGALTMPLAKGAGQLYAVEKDTRLADLLKTELLVQQLSHVTLLNQDVLRLDIAALAPKDTGRLIVAGNLPYNISSQILIRLIIFRQVISHAVVMFQKELAQRIMAPPGSKQYGRISAMLRYCADVSKVMTVGADQFFPKPKIDSMVISIAFKEKPDVAADDEAFLFAVIKAAFGQRRKTLKNALQGSELHIDAHTAETALATAGIDPKRRAETLAIEEFVALSNALKTAL